MQKILKSNLEKYGVTNAGWTPEAIQKRKQTCLEKYNTEYAMQSKEVQDRSRQAVIDKYGVDNVFRLDSIKEKSKKTKLEKYGDENYTNIPKMQETMKERYGGTATLNSEILLKKMEQTMKEKYGVTSFAQTEYAKYKRHHRYAIPDSNIYFDSSWELAVYIFAKDHNIPIEREPVSFSYEYNHKKHIYSPDFKFGENLIEIKGSQFFREDGTMQNPYDHSMDELYKAKHQCALQNNVQFWTSKEMQPILEYVNTTYGFDFLDSFKVITD